MNDIQIFNNPKFGQVRAVAINDETMVYWQGCGDDTGVCKT